MQKTIYRLAIVSMFLVAVVGCARDADSISKEVTIPDSPDGAVLAVAEALQNNHAEALWTALPESYQQDITEITQALSEKMDPDVYDRAFATVMRAIEVLDDRKEIILASETFKSSGADADDLRLTLSNSLVFTDILKASEVATVAGLGSVNWEQFLATTGNEFIKQVAAIESPEGDNPLDSLDSLKVETIEVSENRAMLRISSDDHEPEDVEMAKVEGHWIPAELADDWDRSIEEARQNLAEITPETMAAQKTQIMMVFGMADGLIEQVASLQTPEEFDAAIGPMLAPYIGGASMNMGDDQEWEPTEEMTEEMTEEAPEEE
jgi:hypothetical protein